MLPGAELVIANLLIEYIGYSAFKNVIRQVNAQYVSCVIQINTDDKTWVSDSPYLHAFDGLDTIHHQMEEGTLTEAMNEIGYSRILSDTVKLPNGKALVRLDYIKKFGFKYQGILDGCDVYKLTMNDKPKFLYHGSKYCFDIVKPSQAHGNCEEDSKLGIYAVATKEEAIPFALPFRWYPDEPGGKLLFNTEGKNSYLEYGSIDPNGKGYIYVLPADTFELVNEWEWVSSVEVKPIERIEISVKDYMNTITFSEEAKKIQKELYGL
jgi:hypothetical protein